MLKDNPYSNLKADAKKFLETYPTYESFLANHKRIGARPGFTEDEKKEFYQSMVNAANVSRNLYEVNIPDNNGSNYLSWYEPLTDEQSDKIISAFANAKDNDEIGGVVNGLIYWDEQPTDVEERKKVTADWLNRLFSPMDSYKDATGELWYENIKSVFGTDKETSLLLSQIGFTGITYPAGTRMGGAEEGDTNYVIFKPEDMQIAEHTKFSLKNNVDKNFGTRLKSAIDETETNPSEAQKESGNYKKGHVKFGGYDYTIENPRGSVRSGVDGDGKPWGIKMHDTYGYIRGKFGKDGDHLDMFINDNADLDNWNGDVYVIDQVNPDGSFDEHKVMYGYDSMDDAKKAYFANYSKGWQGLGNITGVSKDEFDKWLDTSKRKLKPFADYAKVKFSQAQGAPMFSLKDKDKARRIEKLRDSEPIEITGKEITPSDDLKQYKKNALEFGKSLRGTYRNEDTGEKIDLTGGNKRGGIREILQHDYKDIEHLQSIAAIPQIIRKSIFIDELPNEDKQHYPDVKSFRYYVCGLKIGGKDYTVKAVVAEQNNGNRYYDHRLTDIEKGKLLSIIPTIQKAGIDGNLPNSAYKDKRLISILQTNPQKNDNEAQKFSLKDEDKTMFGMHNISLDKLRKAIKQGGFAAPSMGVIDSKNGIYSDYGEITLIPKAEKLAKSKGKNAGTFTADGWTPIYPKVELRASKEGKSRIQNDTLVNDKIDEKLGKSLFNRWENYLEKNQGDPMDFAWQYMFEKGMNPEIVRNENPFSDEISNKVLDITKRGTKYQNELTDDEKGELIKLYNDYLESTGKGAVTKEGIKEIIKILKEDIENTKWTLVKKGLQKKIDFFEKYGGDVDDAVGWAYADVLAAAKKGNGVNSYKTFAAAKDKVFADRKMKHDFNKWFDGKLQEYGVEEMLYAGETPSGKSKYVPNTVDNAVKIMKKKGLAGGYGNWSGVGAFIAKLAPTANTLSAMKKAKDKLIPFGDQRHNEVKDQIQKSYNELANDLTETTNGYHSFDMGIDRMQMLAEAQPKDVKGYIKNTWGIEVSDDWVGRYDKLVDAIKNDYPVYYFETKFMRPYGLDEFEKAIVPKDTPKDVLDALKKAGIDVHTYEAGNKKDREKVTMDAVNNSDNIRFSLAGERGAANMDKAEEVTTRLDNLEVARKMEEAKKDAKAIKLATGWERGADGKWRYEIPNFQFNYDTWRDNNKAAREKMDNKDYHSLMRYTNEFYNDMSPVKKKNFDKLMDKYGYKVKEKLTLGDVLDGKGASELFKAYPQLKEVGFGFDRNMNPNDYAGYYSTDNIIKVNASFEYSPSKVRSLLLHEVQHAIQHIEGFAKGGNTEQIEREFNAAQAEWNARYYAYELEEKAKEMDGEYNQSEVEKALIKEYEDLDMTDDLPDKETRIKGFNYFARGYADRSMDDAIKLFRLNERQGVKFDSYQEYLKLAGEVEARNVQKRLGMTDEERRNSLASETEDVAREDQIFLGVDDGGDAKYSLRVDQYQHDLEQWKKDNNLPKDAVRPSIPVREPNESAADFVKRVKDYRKQMALWKTAPQYEQHLLTSNTAQGQFNLELQKGSVLARIALQDSMLPIRKAQEAIMKEVGIDRLNIAEDAYTAENRSHGKGKNEFEEYNDEFLQPLRKSYNKMMKNLGKSYDNVKVYMIAKHGLERNAHIAFKKSLEADYEKQEERINAYKAYKADMDRMANNIDFENGKINFTTWRQNDNAIRTKYAPSYLDYRYDKIGITQDYSGLSALFDGSDFEEAAAELVKDVETKFDGDTNELWYNTNAATKKILRDSWKAGMMSDEVYEFVRGMYDHYIPLRGWGDTNADQVWNYMGGGKGAFNQTLKKANGRGSLADDPIAYIENMAESGILINNKNWVKQHLLLLAENHPTSLLNLSKAWYIKTMDAQGNEEWIPASPNITANMTSQQVKNELENFQKRMEAMEKKGDATQKREHLEISYPQTNSEEREHEVRVMKNGEEYVIYINGDPQLAQAMNNTRAHRVREGLQNSVSQRALASLGRKMAAAYTSLSPLFIPSNYFRDFTMTLASTAIREDARYNYLLRKNMATHWNTFPLVLSYQNGTLREKVRDGEASKTEQMFYDFTMNGGETGFVSSLDVEDLKKKFKNDLKDMNRMAVNPKKIGHVIMDSIETLNRAIEDSNRFMVYMTSIQYGRSIDEAVNDAKDVTLNFNRKGTGEHGWQTFRNLYLFINPAIQSLQTLGALAKHHPFKFTAVTTAWLTSGVLVPMVNIAAMRIFGAIASWWSGDDDKDRYKDIEDKYWQFTKWDRRNNLILWVPGTHNFIKIPLAQEFRGFYGVGDMIASKLWGGEKAEESWEDYGLDLMGQVVDMLPLDPTGYDGNIAVSLMPNPIRPMFELAFNVDFTGKPLFKDSEYNKYDPNFTKAFAGTPDWLVRISKMVNSVGNDYPDVQQNAIDKFGDPRFNLNNPAVVDHVLSSYLGGAYTMGSQILGVATKALNGDEIKMADVPLVSKFVSNPDDRPVSKKQGDEFWTTKERHDRAANTLSKLKKKAKVDGDYSTLDVFFNSDEYKQYKLDDKVVKKYQEEKKAEAAKESGDDYQPKKLTADAVYELHATPKDDFEDLKMSQIYPKVNGIKKSWEALLDMVSSQADSFYNENADAIQAADEVADIREQINEIKSDFLTDGKDSFNAEGMKEIRQLRKEALDILEKANKMIVARQKEKADNQ